MYVARKYRLSNHVGGVRKRLAKMIVDALAKEDIEARCEPKNLWPAQGGLTIDVDGFVYEVYATNELEPSKRFKITGTR